MYIYNPDNFDPTILPKQITAGTTKKLHDISRLFLHILITAQSKSEFKDRKGFTPLKHRILQDVLDFVGWPKVRNMLVNLGVIECDYRSFIGEKCYWFRFGPKYSDRPVVRIWLDNKKLSKRNLPKEPELKNEIHEMMWHWLNQVELNYDGAKERLQKASDKVKNISMKWLSLEKLRAKDLFFSADERGRVYHNVVNMWSEFRKFITIKNQKLVNIDIRNSQPLILAVKLKQDIYNNHIYLYRAPFCLNGLYKDVDNYIELAEQGKIYDHLMSVFGYEDEKRSWFKKKFFSEVLYSECSKATKLAQKFTDMFPNVAELICRYKEKDHRDLPLLMQKTEADLMINGVCGRIVKDYKHIPFITIHDSILTLPEYVPLVKNLIIESFACLGITPTLS